MTLRLGTSFGSGRVRGSYGARASAKLTISRWSSDSAALGGLRCGRQPMNHSEINENRALIVYPRQSPNRRAAISHDSI